MKSFLHLYIKIQNLIDVPINLAFKLLMRRLKRKLSYTYRKNIVLGVYIHGGSLTSLKDAMEVV